MFWFSKNFHGQSARGLSQLFLCTPLPISEHVIFFVGMLGAHDTSSSRRGVKTQGGGKGLGERGAEGSPRNQGEAPHQGSAGQGGSSCRGNGRQVPPCPDLCRLSNAPVDHVGRNTEGTPVLEEHLWGLGALSLGGAAKHGPGDRR